MRTYGRTRPGATRPDDGWRASRPTALDAPDIRIVELVEERDVVAPFGAKPAVANQQ
ncbi:hypothetical protein [Streptomyces sp. MST-110588]|uniref:hypothetical protein n=1 Tax=Streptomyces sp. MST-110588 TaxID=2833628 RepID=UPI001F5E1065|nr:hypothetical protein [Streptomyces sp. MST-110588]UNO44432.1 hypothetical protein KGS77_22370 [Streptomyces sp. MST-110588]